MIRPPRVALAVAAALAVAEGAVLLLRPRNGVLEPVHVELESYFTPAEIERSRAYGRPQLALALAGSALETAALAALVARPPRALRGLRRPVVGGAAAGAALTLGLAALRLPLGAVAHRRARAAGLATQGWDGWARDVARARGLGAVMAAAGGAGVVALTERFGRRWWVVGAAGSVGVGALAAFAGPVLIDPLFNRFTPLADGPVRDDVLALARGAGVDVGEVYVADASRRTTAVNAYVTGLGATKRVVLYDTLLGDGFDRAQVRLVVAHELAHVRHRDVLRGLAFAALVAPAALLAVDEAAAAIAPGARGPAALPALVLAGGTVGTTVGIAANRLSRRLERRADTFSLRATGDAQAFVAFEQAVVSRNLADPDPPRVLRWLSTHPPALERIGIAAAYRNAPHGPAPHGPAPA